MPGKLSLDTCTLMKILEETGALEDIEVEVKRAVIGNIAEKITRKIFGEVFLQEMKREVKQAVIVQALDDRINGHIDGLIAKNETVFADKIDSSLNAAIEDEVRRRLYTAIDAANAN